MSVGVVNGMNYASTAYVSGPQKGYVSREQAIANFKPGLIVTPDFEQQQRAKRNRRLLALGTALALAFIFRGKIKEGYRLLKPEIIKVLVPVKTFIKTKTPAVFNALKNTKVFIVENGKNIVESFKTLFKK